MFSLIFLIVYRERERKVCGGGGVEDGKVGSPPKPPKNQDKKRKSGNKKVEAEEIMPRAPDTLLEKGQFSRYIHNKKGIHMYSSLKLTYSGGCGPQQIIIKMLYLYIKKNLTVEGRPQSAHCKSGTLE